MDAWIDSGAERIARRAQRELEALVAVSSPSGDVEGSDEAVAVATAFLPERAEAERLPCSTPEHAADLYGRVSGSGSRRLLLLGHIDTVIGHSSHRRLERRGDRLVGSGAVDMKGGVALALGVLRELAARPELYAEVGLLLVTDEEWRTSGFGHAERFGSFDGCMCFEAGQLTSEGHEAVIVKRKAAATLRIAAQGRSAHSGSAPEQGRSALLALASAAQAVAASSDPHGPERLTAVPTILRAGDAFNVVPGSGELVCDLRADSLAAIEAVLAGLPAEQDGVQLEAAMVRAWPGMDAREATAPLLAAASERLGRPVAAGQRGGASDASHMSAHIRLTVDGFGPRGGGAHTPEEWVSASSLRSRAEVALAFVAALLEAPG